MSHLLQLGRVDSTTPPRVFLEAVYGESHLVGDFPAGMFICGHGQFAIQEIEGVREFCEAEHPPDVMAIMGGSSTARMFIEKSRDEGVDYMAFLHYQLERIVVMSHDAETIFIVNHTFCGGAKERVLRVLPQAELLYEGKVSPVEDERMALRHQEVELQIQGEDSQVVIDWVKVHFGNDLRVVTLRATRQGIADWEEFVSKLACLKVAA